MVLHLVVKKRYGLLALTLFCLEQATGLDDEISRYETKDVNTLFLTKEIDCFAFIAHLR